MTELGDGSAGCSARARERVECKREGVESSGAGFIEGRTG